MKFDDFGPGYSSLAHRQKAPIELVRVDRSSPGDREYSGGRPSMVADYVNHLPPHDLTLAVDVVDTQSQRYGLPNFGGAGDQSLFAPPVITDAIGHFVYRDQIGDCLK